MKPFFLLTEDKSVLSLPDIDTGHSHRSVREIAVLFTDIVGSSIYFKAHGNLAGRKLLQLHETLASKAVKAHEGSLVKTIGDSIMAYFLDPVNSVKAAIGIQQEFSSYNRTAEAQEEIHVRIGVHSGTGIIEEKDIFGDVVNIAAKLVSIAGTDQIFISEQIYSKVMETLPLVLEKADIQNQSKTFKDHAAYRVIWSDTTKFELESRLLLYVKPLWRLRSQAVRETWERVLEARHQLFKGLTSSESILPDRSIALALDMTASPIHMAIDIIELMRKEFPQDHTLATPLQLIIDAGPFVRENKLLIDKMEVKWKEITPGEIYISSKALGLISTDHSFQFDPPFNGQHTHTFHKILFPNDHANRGPRLFKYQSALVIGDNPPCYYCGGKNHQTCDCHSKIMLTYMDNALKKLGYESAENINLMFQHYILTASNAGKRGNEGEKAEDSSYELAYQAFYELKAIFQIRFLEVICSSEEKSWSSIKKIRKGENKGGAIWLAQDCIRTSNLTQAEAILKSLAHEFPEDYRLHCSKAFLNIEKGDFRQAEYHLKQALYYAKTKPRKIFILFQLFRLYDLSGKSSEAVRKLREIISIDPRCHEAIYQSIIYKFREKSIDAATAGLTKFIQNHPEFFINTLIDPKTGPYAKIIQPELERLLNMAKKRAEDIIPEAEKELNNLKIILDGRGEKVQIATALWKKIEDLSKSESYLGYIDVIRYAGLVISMARETVTTSREEIEQTIWDLEKSCKRYRSVLNTFHFSRSAALVHNKIGLIRRELDSIRSVLDSESPDIFKKASARTERLLSETAKLERKLEKMDMTRQLKLFLLTFFKKSLFLQLINLVTGIVVIPLIFLYANFGFLELDIDLYDLWSYQKGALILGGISGLLIAFFRTLKKLYTV